METQLKKVENRVLTFAEVYDAIIQLEKLHANKISKESYLHTLD